MPQKTRQQSKSYYTNYLKPKVGIENQTVRLPSEEISEFILNCLRCEKNWSEVQKRCYPEQSAQSIRQKYTRLLNYKVEIFACYEALMKYPDTNFPFNNKLLKVLSTALPIILKYRDMKHDEASTIHAFWNIFTYFDVEAMLTQINRIIADR